MKFDFSKPVMLLNGTAAKLGADDLTFRYVAENALLGGGPEDQPTMKVARFKLAMRIVTGADPVDLSIDEVKLLNDLVQKTSGVIVAGRFDEFVNGGGGANAAT